MAENLGIPFLETSAKNAANVEEVCARASVSLSLFRRQVVRSLGGLVVGKSKKRFSDTTPCYHAIGSPANYSAASPAAATLALRTITTASLDTWSHHTGTHIRQHRSIPSMAMRSSRFPLDSHGRRRPFELPLLELRRPSWEPPERLLR
eukprot:scaffold492_cov257-Pinguiococcus_pyrenoidosus.AAC.26